MTEMIETAVAAAPDFGDHQPALVDERYPQPPGLTLPELDVIGEALHAMRVGGIKDDTRPEAEAFRALLASADAKIRAMREARRLRRRGAIDLDIDAALVAIDAAMEACSDGPSMTDWEPAFAV